MPAVSEKQRKFFGAELGRKREGKKTRTGLSERQLKEYAATPLQKKSAHGSGAFTDQEIAQGYRRI